MCQRNRLSLSEQWVKRYQQKRALFIHDGDRKRPHVELSSGLHSGTFFNSELVMEDPFFLYEASYALLRHFRKSEGKKKIKTVNRVVGPAMGAITLAHELAYHITVMRERTCLRAYVEKKKRYRVLRKSELLWVAVNEFECGDFLSETDEEHFVFDRTAIRSGERILLCDNVVTTGGGVGKTAELVMSAGGIVMPYILALVNRSGQEVINGRKIISLVEEGNIPTYEPKVCPFCKLGSEALNKPKKHENWTRLFAKY